MMMITGWFLADMLLKSTGVLLVALGFNLLTPAAPAARRHLVWLMSLVAIASMPLLCGIMPAWRILPWSLTEVTSTTSTEQGNPIDRKDVTTTVRATRQ